MIYYFSGPSRVLELFVPVGGGTWFQRPKRRDPPSPPSVTRLLRRTGVAALRRVDAGAPRKGRTQVAPHGPPKAGKPNGDGPVTGSVAAGFSCSKRVYHSEPRELTMTKNFITQIIGGSGRFVRWLKQLAPGLVVLAFWPPVARRNLPCPRPPCKAPTPRKSSPCGRVTC